MPTINWRKVRETPWTTIRIITLASWKTLMLIICRPITSSPLSLRNSIARIWLGTIFAMNSSILYGEPTGHDTQIVETVDFKAYVVPSTPASQLKNADVVIIYCHGGGMIIGHPLQYLDDYKRWASKAKMKGKCVIFMGLQYPLSTSKKWPAQRESMVELYRWLLAQSVSSSAIVFAGDSAGCDLLYLSLLHIRDHEPKIPQPSCVVSVSPWLDWTGAKTIGHSNWHSDFMFYYDDICPALNNALRPESLPFDSPEINALLASDLSRLPPQLIYYSRHEILQSDSTRWIERSRASGVDITEQAVDGEMHTFAVGWPITSQEMQNRCDELTLRYIFEHTSR